MDEMIARCGLACHGCGAYIATINDDDEKRAEVAREWSKMYDAELKPSDINCDGCLSDGPRVFHHATVCEIRKCAGAKGLANCAHCEDYACEKLEGLFGMAPEARARLNAVREGL